MVPQTRFMEFRGDARSGQRGGVSEGQRPDGLAGGLRRGVRRMEQTSGRFSVQGGTSSRSGYLLLYSGATTLCGYFFGQPSHVGGNTWRMDIALCDYDFSGLYEGQKQAFDQDSTCPSTSPRTRRPGAARSGASTPAIYLSDKWRLFRKPGAAVRLVEPGAVWRKGALLQVCGWTWTSSCPRSSKDIWAYVLLLDKNYRSVGYTVLTS